ILLLENGGAAGVRIAGKRLQRERVEPVAVRTLLRGAELAVDPEDGQLAGIPRHTVSPPVRMDELVPALGKPSQDRDTGGSAASGNDRRVDRRAVGSPHVRP